MIGAPGAASTPSDRRSATRARRHRHELLDGFIRYADDMHLAAASQRHPRLGILLLRAASAPDPSARTGAGNGGASDSPPSCWRCGSGTVARPRWKHGSVNEDYAAIQCPVFATGGWMDGYSNAIPRLRKPHGAAWARRRVGAQVRPPGVPGRRRSSRCLRWFDHLRPRYGHHARAHAPPSCRSAGRRYAICPALGRRAGRRRERQRQRLPRTPAAFQARRGRAVTLLIAPMRRRPRGRQWCPHGIGGYGPQCPTDQRRTRAEPRLRDRTAVGPRSWASRRSRHARVNRPVAFVAVRLNDVFLDGRVSRVSFGVTPRTAPPTVRAGPVEAAPIRLNHRLP